MQIFAKHRLLSSKPGRHAPLRDTDFRDDFEFLYKKHVPAKGKRPSKTKAGEILRAVGRIEKCLKINLLSFWDIAGTDLCGSEAVYLDTYPEFSKWIKYNEKEEPDNREADKLKKIALDLLEKKPELYKQRNTVDSHEDYRREAINRWNDGVGFYD